jgi:general secretion pathway protein B
MSLILEALKKAETERRQGQPGKPDPAAPEQRPPQRRRGLPILVLILVLLVNAILLAWWLKPWANPQPPQHSPAPAMKTPPTPKPSAPAANQETTTAREATSGQEPTAATGSTAVQESRAAAEASGDQETAPVPAPASSAQEQAATPEPTAVPEPLGAPTAAPAPAAGPVVPTGKAPGQQVPAYRELPPAERARIAEIDVQLHYYTAVPERRLVRINGTNLHEGEGAGGVRVDEIRPDGMVLEAGGVTFFYPASRL